MKNKLLFTKYIGIVFSISILTSVNSQAQSSPSVPKGFVLIEAGSFLMGSHHGENDEKPVHRVTLSQPFFILDHEVTVAEYRRFIQATKYRTPNSCSYGKPNWGRSGRDKHPINCVSWFDSQAYIKWLNLQEGEGVYRLPTEAEWEYAARAGTTTKYSCGNNESCLDTHGWYGSNSDYDSQPVKTKQANPWGLYDTHGNVWEWVHDWYGNYPSHSVIAPQGESSGFHRVYRGGRWVDFPTSLRSANRYDNSPELRSNYLGFRIVRMTR